CPYCGSSMRDGTCPSCGHICPRCGTPSKELACPQCGSGSFIHGYSPTGSPAPAQSPEFSDVRQILGRMPSRREFNMVRGMIDRDKERIHRLVELLCNKFPAPLSRELIEMRALQVRKKASKSGSDLTHAECVVFAFLEAARHSGMLEPATRALGEAQLLDANLRLGLSKAKLPPLKFVVEVSGCPGREPKLLVDGAQRSCKTVLLEELAHGRTYLMLWHPLLSDCLEGDSGSRVKRVSAGIEDGSGLVPLMIAPKERPDERNHQIEMALDPKRFFYGFTTRKEIEVDIGVPGLLLRGSDGDPVLRRIGKQLDGLQATALLFRMAGSPTASGALWPKARKMIAQPALSQMAVTPTKKAASAIVASDMRSFLELDAGIKARLSFGVRKIPLGPRDAAYTCAKGLIVPSEFSAAVGIEWNDILSLAVKF
ncbi:MAG: zinc ribbon domain-containing protein, partial [Nitrososphaerales archaeon]